MRTLYRFTAFRVYRASGLPGLGFRGLWGFELKGFSYASVRPLGAAGLMALGLSSGLSFWGTRFGFGFIMVLRGGLAASGR